MRMDAQFLFLGTGGSLGIPVVSCHCRVCRSPSPLNKRLRPSGLLTLGKKRFLIDCGPDFREQAIRYGIDSLDGVLITHTHYDHVGGIDDLRVFHFLRKEKLPCLASKETYAEIHHRFYYLLQKPESELQFSLLEEDFGRTHFEGVSVDYLSYAQAGMKVTGFRIGSFAYVSDIRKYDELVIESLKGVETLVLSALRFTTSHVHFSIDEAIEFSRRVGASKTFLTHIAHDIDHEEANNKLPPGIVLAHDGLEIAFKS